MAFARPVVVTSQCLEFAACRYNAQTIRAPFVRLLVPHVELRPICPEVEVGLGVPRDPIRLVELRGARRLVQPSTGRDITDAMRAFTERFCAGLGDVDGFILKSRSPSCGIKDTKVYADTAAQQPAGKGTGYFGGAVLDRFPYAAVEDEGRLTNFRLRHHFLSKLFTRAAFRDVKRAGSAAALVRFHSAHKLLLMVSHQAALRELGRIVARAGAGPVADAVAAYETELGRALAAPARTRSTVNGLLHAFGYFKKDLAAPEKRHFLAVVEAYRAGRATLATPLVLVRSWIERFGQEYLAQQTFFEPYPADLLVLDDSARTGFAD